MDELFETRYFSQEPVTSLPPDYPAYCIFVPSGMGNDFEQGILAKLQVWGESQGKNLYVAPWDIGDSSYIQFMQIIGFKNRPAAVLTDTNNPTRDSFIITIDDPLLVRDIPRLTQILPSILDLILMKDTKDATKKAVNARQQERLRSIVNNISSVLSKVKLTLSWSGVSIQV